MKIAFRQMDDPFFQIRSGKSYKVKKNGGIAVAFVSTLLGYLGKLVFYVILAVCGVFAGKKLRDSKNAKTKE